LTQNGDGCSMKTSLNNCKTGHDFGLNYLLP